MKAAGRRVFGDRLSFFGGISSRQTLPYGSCIAAPAHDLPRDARPENVAAMIEVLKAR